MRTVEIIAIVMVCSIPFIIYGIPLYRYLKYMSRINNFLREHFHHSQYAPIAYNIATGKAHDVGGVWKITINFFSMRILILPGDSDFGTEKYDLNLYKILEDYK